MHARSKNRIQLDLPIGVIIPPIECGSKQVRKSSVAASDISRSVVIALVAEDFRPTSKAHRPSATPRVSLRGFAMWEDPIKDGSAPLTAYPSYREMFGDFRYTSQTVADSSLAARYCTPGLCAAEWRKMVAVFKPIAIYISDIQ